MSFKFLTNKIKQMKLMKKWDVDAFCMPSPPYVKRKVLLRNGYKNATWVETGTYRGDTTHLLSQDSKFVYSIEPEAKLFEAASARFANIANVEIIKGTSEYMFPTLLPELQGDCNFWLDGHFSGGSTFQGAQDTPIVEELKAIADNMQNFTKLAVLVDDIRCFDPTKEGFESYPDLNFLVDWANQQKLRWNIEHDIFVAKSH